MRNKNKKQSGKRKEEFLLLSNRGLGNSGNLYKLTLLGLLVLFGLVPQTFADDQVNNYEGTFISWWNQNLDKAGDKLKFTAYGESLGCASQPTKEVTKTFTSATQKTLTDYFGVNSYGLVNIYAIYDNQKYYVTSSERLVSKSYYFSLNPGNKPATYLIEFYECPKPASQKSVKTPDGYQNDDLICDHGTSISRVICKTGYCSDGVKYEEVMSCKAGTYCEKDGGNCITEKTDGERETVTGQKTEETKDNSYLTRTDTSDDTQIKYEVIVDQLAGKVFDEDVVNEKIAEQRLKIEIETDKSNNESAADIPISLIISIALIVGIFLIIVFIILIPSKNGGNKP